MDHQKFLNILERPVFARALDGLSSVAVAVSGGADSMALLRLLVSWAKERDLEIHALTVDHGLRAEAAGEAARVAACCGEIGARHVTLQWEGDKPEAAVQEAARAARYDLMAEYCAAQGIKALFLGHHRDDQAETVLFRLAKGSGLKGLGGMRAVTERDGVMVMRPLLEVDKADLIAYSAAAGQDFIDDPSNQDDNYARVRLRAAADVLAAEGLTAKRLSVTAARLSRADEALEVIADGVAEAHCRFELNRAVFNMAVCRDQPEEIALRVLIRAVEHLRGEATYLPRMEKLEQICADLRAADHFTKRTLGGLIFERRDDLSEIVICRE